MARTSKTSSYFDKLETEMKSNQSTLSLVLGALIVLVIGVLIFNYFNRDKTPEITPEAQTSEEGDVSPENLPGKYTVKEGDTLFTIAQTYYKDGYKYTKLAEENKLADVNSIEVGQVLEISKLEETELAQLEPTIQVESQTDPTEEPEVKSEPVEETPAVGGGNTTVWGPKIESNSYTVIEGDWLSTIAARAYGDIMAYTKLAEANSISNPDVIIPGQVIKIPR